MDVRPSDLCICLRRNHWQVASPQSFRVDKSGIIPTNSDLS